MFENEIKFISDFVLNKVKDLGSFFTIEKFLSTDIHPSIKKYVEGEFNYLIQQDRKKLIDNSLFDYSGSKISNYFNLIADEIKKTKKISYEDVKNIILQAVSFNANYVVRPKWSLSKLIFGNNKSVSLNEVQMMLNYTYYFEYLNNVFLAYMSKKKIMNISVTEFELIMNKIDRELFTLHQSKLVDNALYAIADFYNIGGLNRSTISVEWVESFLKEKNLTELLFKLKRGFPSPVKKKIDIDDIRKVLYSAFPLESPFIEDQQTSEPIENEKHFDNPLKEVPVVEEPTIDEHSQPETETVIDLKEENSSTDFFQEEAIKDQPETVNEIPKQVDEIVEDKITDLPEDLTSSEINDTLNEVIALENNEPVAENIKIVESTNDEEEILKTFTDAVEENKSEEEIIILDEKEEKDLLKFYDNEIEISMDDDNEILKEDEPLTKFEEDLGGDAEEIKLESESSNEIEQVAQDQTERIEFEHESDENELNSDSLEKKSNEDENPNEPKSKVSKQNFDDMFSFLSRKEIDRIIRNLFNSDSEDFANMIEKMSACNSLDEATEILNNIFKYARIKPHSKDATLLTKAVTKYFGQDI